MDHQVLVVGAGPVGLTLALELARYGISVRIIDKAPRRSDKSKALVVWSRTLELLDRAGCAGDFVAAGLKVHAANIIAGDKPIGKVGFSEVSSAFSYALMVPQSDTERLLEARLVKLGVAVERQVELVAFSQDADGVSGTVRHADGAQQSVRVSYLVGCDGAHSTVRHTLGLPFLGETLNSDWLLADIHLAGLRYPTDELVMFWHEDGILACFPISGDRYRVIADIGPSKSGQLTDPSLDQIQAVVDRRGPSGLVVSQPVWLSAFRINERKVRDYRVGRVFVAGDAAHVHSPAGGQGMNTGMQDAFNLAWKLALVCGGAAHADRLLESYSVERSAVGAQVLAAAGRMTALALLRNHAAQTVRNLIGGFLLGLAPVRRIMADTLTEVSVGYDKSPLNGPHHAGRPEPGERMPPVEGQAPVGAGDKPRFALFAPSSDAIDRLLREHAALLEPGARPPPREGSAWLVRPDGYVASVVAAGELGEIGTYLQSLR